MSSGGIDPLNNPRAWDVVVIAGVESPGICEVAEVKRANEFDVKKGKGTLGSTVTFVGRPPAKGSIKFKLWDDGHFKEWDEFRPLFKYDPTKKDVTAVDIYHPSLADIDIKSVVIESIGNIVHEGGGLYTCTVEYLEYFPGPKKSAVSTPSGSKTGNGSSVTGQLVDPVADAQQKEIAALLKEAGS